MIIKCLFTESLLGLDSTGIFDYLMCGFALISQTTKGSEEMSVYGSEQ